MSDVTADPPRFESIEELHAVLAPVMKAVAVTIGEHCEVVLHDLSRRDMDQTIHAIENGHVSGRSVGGPSTDRGLTLLKDESVDHDAFGYRGRTADGRELHCSSVYYRNRAGSVIGALCINVDLTALENVRSIISSLLPTQQQDEPEEIVGPSIDAVLDGMLESAIAEIGKPPPVMVKDDRIAVLRRLEARGAFHIKRAVDRVSQRLGISKVTAYSYLDTIRNS
ncbi:helix-turn-helix transcriptional regulator [Nesterenkonia sp. K-15-9-6]|uniref:helix-turn-helix transcriptional regulator n=1 Tax=Nesterenkonia sp. K-15-9-6 TaxID=3093918 RepID=UPI0026C9BDEB